VLYSRTRALVFQKKTENVLVATGCCDADIPTPLQAARVKSSVLCITSWP
jgi:hypothetical protein